MWLSGTVLTEPNPTRPRKPVTALALALFSVVLGLSLTFPALAADPVRTRAWPHPGFARIVFDWPAAVTFEARIEARTLTVNFGRALETDFARMQSLLSDYIVGADLENDGATVRIHLKGEYGLRTSTSNTSVVIDLLDAAASAPAPAQTPAAAAADAAPAVPLRVGKHADFTRVVFDWTRLVEYSVDRSGTAVSIRFDERATFNLGRLGRGQRPLVEGATTSLDAASSDVVLQIESDTRVRHFREGTKVVVDVVKDSPAAPAQAAAPATAVAPPPEPARPAASTPEPPRTTVAETPAPTPNAAVPEPAAPEPVAVAESQTSPPTELRTADSDASPPPAVAAGLVASVEAGAEEPVLVFVWTEPVPAAFFTRAGYYWAVFAARGAAELQPIPAEAGRAVFLVEQVPISGGTALRFKIREDLRASASREGPVWRVELARRPPAPVDPIVPLREASAMAGPRMLLPSDEPVRRVELPDPEVGDFLYVVPLRESGRGVPVTRVFAQFTLLASAQGVAIVPRSDAIEVRPQRNGIEIAAPQGLAISEVGETELAAAEGAEAGSTRAPPPSLAPSVFQYGSWLGNFESFDEGKKQYQLALARAPAGGIGVVQWEFAKYYFAHGFTAETLGLMDMILERDPAADEDLVFRAVRGAAHFSLGHYEEASRDLLDPAFGLDPGAALWRGSLLAQRKEFDLARQEFILGEFAYFETPPVFRARFQLASAKTSLVQGDFESVEINLSALLESDPSVFQRSEADLIFGKTLIESGDLDGGLEALATAIHAGYRPVRPWAQMAYTEARLADSRISTDVAIAELDTLRFAWRGGTFEFALLERLGELYLEVGNYREALESMRDRVSNFGEHEKASAVAGEMNDIFRDLYLERGADSLEPVKALALFFDFRELTPVGRDGDAMIRQLADRLVEVDLLGRAAELIQHQVEFRLKGEEKSRVAAKLAAIYILDRQPEEALEALQGSRWRANPEIVKRQRDYLKAQALIDLQRYDEMMELLDGDGSPTAESLRASAFWRTSQWAAASATYERLLNGRWTDPEPLSAVERQRVLRLAVAFVLSDNEVGVDRARQHFAPFMDGTAESDAFEIITGRVDRTSMSFRTVASAIAQVVTLEEFMESYRSSFEEGFGAIN